MAAKRNTKKTTAQQYDASTGKAACIRAYLTDHPDATNAQVIAGLADVIDVASPNVTSAIGRWPVAEPVPPQLKSRVTVYDGRPGNGGGSRGGANREAKLAAVKTLLEYFGDEDKATEAVSAVMQFAGAFGGVKKAEAALESLAEAGGFSAAIEQAEEAAAEVERIEAELAAAREKAKSAKTLF